MKKKWHKLWNRHIAFLLVICCLSWIGIDPGFSGSALPAEKILRGRRGVSDDGIGRLETGAARDPAGRDDALRMPAE